MLIVVRPSCLGAISPVNNSDHCSIVRNQLDPIEELMQSVSISSTPASEASPFYQPNKGLYSPLSTPVEEPRQPPGLENGVIAPSRPPKKPLSDVRTASQQGSGSQGSHTSSPIQDTSYFRIPRKPCPAPASNSSLVVTSCIDTPMTFASTWYSHPGAPEFLICLRCYMDHIFDTGFADAFQEFNFDDGKPRVCRFSKPRVKEHIFPRAVSTSYLQPLIDHMRRRPGIPDCRGADGVLGTVASTVNIKWYNTPDNSIPGFLACEACYEDYSACAPGLSTFLQPHHHVQGPQDTWACDFALPFIQKQYEADSKNADTRDGWNNFAIEAKARINCPPCGQARSIRSRGRNWFQPIAGPAGIIICASCYFDHVVHSGEESKWHVAPGLTEANDMQVRCSMGGRFNIRLVMARAHEVKDFSVFWDAMKKLENHPLCQDEGIHDAQWWTLPNQPEEFQICGACYDAICQPLGVKQFFRKKSALSGGALLEMYTTQNPTALVEYAAMYAAIPPCGRDEARTKASWYGWDDCRICTECFHDFAKQHRTLADQMTLRNKWIEGGAMCEMYSPRMRQLYLNCSQKTPAGLDELLRISIHRRQMYYQTVPQIKQLIQQQKLALGQQRMLNSLSSFHTNIGQLQQITLGSAYTYSSPGVGSFNTMDELQGARFGQQAMGVVAGSHDAVGIVTVLEKQWRAVE
ncbi:hypothetical protein TruAng_001392 [Truncatella angustata]|nr:hypothetical protein TruAng_001392 [Truncatella angustata]